MNGRIWFRLLALLVAGVALLYQFVMAPRFTNPETGRSARLGLNPQQESALGLQGYQQVLAGAQTVRSGPEYDQVTRVTHRLAVVAAKDAPDFDWQVSVLRDPQLNAFCLPGGKICVYTGILPVTENDAGLATVLGHEMAHATSHHGAERVFQQSATETAMLGVRGAMGDMSYQQQQLLMGLIGAGAKYGVLLPFSRAHESEADHVGLIYMARAGYDPHESLAFWKRMAAQTHGQPPEYMSTHPLHETRIRALEDELPAAMSEYEKAEKAEKN